MKPLIMLAASVLLLSACIHQPYSTTSEVDDRPTLSFAWEDSSTSPQDAWVYLNDRRMGSVYDYLYPERRVRVLDGTHEIEVRVDGEVIYADSRTLGANSDYTIEVH